jgi:hypothetical protein
MEILLLLNVHTKYTTTFVFIKFASETGRCHQNTLTFEQHRESFVNTALGGGGGRERERETKRYAECHELAGLSDALNRCQF